MRRTEELMLLRAVLEIGRKVSALSVDTSKPPGLHWETHDEHDLLRALVPIRRLMDEEERRAARRA